MKNLKTKRLALITNFILISILIVVSIVAFVPQQIIPIYSESKTSAIYNGNKQSKKISLMFNVYENTQVVNEIIEVLGEFNVKATFFIGGCWADDNGVTLERLVQNGHEIANHGYFHKDHKKLSYENNIKEITNTNTVISSLCNVTPTLFAPPSGSFSQNTLDACNHLGMSVIMWTKDTIDWRDKSEQLVYERATKNLTGGDLVLMHPKEHTLKALPRILEYVKSNGFIQCTVSENLL